MFRMLHKWKLNHKGQAGVVILFLVAIAFVIYALSLNIGNYTKTKMITDLSATSGASMLASQMASFGQNLLMSQLGGEYKFCKSSGILGALISFIIAVVVAYITLGSGATLAFKILAVAGAVLSGASLVLNITVIQPGITKAWNKIIFATLPIKDRFIENGIQSGAGQAITDPVNVPDLIDFDEDGVYGYIGASGTPADHVARYAVYYQLVRLLGIRVEKIPEISRFSNGLKNFIYQLPANDPDCPGGCAAGEECVPGPDPDPTVIDGTCKPAWGLYDPVPVPGQVGPAISTAPAALTLMTPDPTNPCNPNFLGETYATEPSIPSECNPCCVPLTIEDPRSNVSGQVAVRPSCCDAVTDSCGTATTCADRSPYGITNPAIGPSGSSYSFVYDPFYDNPENTFKSFRELLGRDDENQYYSKQSDIPNYGQQFIRPGASNLDVGFTVRDTTGYYADNPPLSPIVPENRPGIFGLLHKITDNDPLPENIWGFDLSAYNTSDPNFHKMPACKWCDARLGAAASCDTNLPTEMTQLSLPEDPASLQYNTSYCVDTSIDKVHLTPGISIPANQCAPADLTAAGVNGFWKSGADRYCTLGDSGSGSGPQWPYYANCPKHQGCFGVDANGNTLLDSNGNPIPAPCVCGEGSSPPNAWPEDPLDNFIYDSSEFIQKAKQLLGNTISQLNIRFEAWYDDWAPWIDPGPGYTIGGTPIPCYARAVESPPGSGTYVTQCQQKKGWLYLWRDNLAYMLQSLKNLRDTSFVGNSCSDTWCVPPSGCPAPPTEAATFDANGNSIRGDMEDVIACLDYNSNNSAAFGACAQTCDPASCNIEFPRSMVPGFDPNAASFTNPDPAYRDDRIAFLNCLQNCGAASCGPLITTGTLAVSGTLSVTGTLPAAGSGPSPGYSYPAGTFDEVSTCTPGTWTTGNTVYDALVADLNLASGSNSCDMSTSGWLYQIHQSYLEALNEDPKMAMRRDFLKKRLAELDNAIAVLQDGLDHFDDFIINTVAPLIQARIDFANRDPNDHHPYHMIYGWEDPPDKNGNRGLWHIVKVEARIPQRCGSGSCEGYPNLFGGADPEWPDVNTYTKGFLGMTRCYELINRNGSVKFRTTRVDEAPRNSGGSVSLASGIQFWKFRKDTPGRSVDPTLWETLPNVCRPLPNPVNARGSNVIYGGAFLIDTRSEDPPCWDQVEQILGTGGISSEVCAAYYGKEGSRRGFTFDFVPCKRGGQPVF